MYEIEMVAKAIEIAVLGHKDQFRVGGNPYIVHPARVALAVQHHGYQAMQVAWMHDLIEDTTVTLADLRECGFSEAVVAAVDSVTRRDGETYMDMIRRAAQDSLGRLVKLADNADNMAGLDCYPEEVAAGKRKRYARARALLEEAQ